MRKMKKNLVQFTLMMLAVAGLMSSAGQAQQTNQTAVERDGPFRIFGVVWRGETEVEAGFRSYLDQRGIPYEFTIRNLNLDRGNAPPIVEEIRQAKPDLVYTWGTGTTTSIVGKAQTDEPDKYVRDIPSIFVLVAYPQEAGIVESYESTGRGTTGVAFLAPVEAQLNSILAYMPIKKLAAIYDSKSSNSRINIAQMSEAAPKLGIEFLALPVPLNENEKSDASMLDDLIWQAKEEGAEMLYMGPDSLLTRNSDLYTSTAIAAGLPTFASTQAPLKNSRAMFGLVTDYHTLGKLAGVQAERILVGDERPEDLPVARLDRFKLWVNIDVVHEIDMFPPINLISIADFQTTTK